MTNSKSIDLMTSGDILRVLGLNRKTLNEWKRRGVLRPTSGGDGTGYPGLYSSRDILAIAVGLNLRGRGFSVPHAGNVVNLILAMPLSALKDEWAMGRRLLVVVGEKAYPRLLTHEAVYQNPSIDMPAMFASGLPVAVIDLHQAYSKLMERINETRGQAEPTGDLSSCELTTA